MLWGAVLGDVVGSVYEHGPVGTTDFPLLVEASRFTDDTVLTVATADALLTDGDYARAYQRWGRRHPDAGYGGSFLRWVFSPDPEPYGSWGNGSAMRVSPVAYAFDSAEEVLREARRSAAVTHDHPEGIRGAQAVALAVFLARTAVEPEEIRREVTRRFGYDLERRVGEVRPGYRFDVSCQGSVPEAILCFLESGSVEEAVRLAVSLGGDSDTQAAIAGSIAEAHHGGVPEPLLARVRGRLPAELVGVIDAFEARFGAGR